MLAPARSVGPGFTPVGSSKTSWFAARGPDFWLAAPPPVSSSTMADIDEGDTESGGGSGAALVYPLEAGQVRKGAMAMLKGNPCKVVDYRWGASKKQPQIPGGTDTASTGGPEQRRDGARAQAGVGEAEGGGRHRAHTPAAHTGKQRSGAPRHGWPARGKAAN